MENEIYGYTGKLLRVNMTTKTGTVEEIPRKVYSDYLGGRGLVAKYCYDEIPKDVNPTGPENKIFFALGPLTGTHFPASGRYVVGGFSPHSLSYTRSVSGGAWGANLKWAGYDMLIIEGASDTWQYIYVTENGVEFKDAQDLCGLSTEETEEKIIEKLDNPRAKVATIGPSGEKMVTMACVQTERRSAGRGGIGCLMGSKKLKGIAVFGTNKQKLYNEERFNQRCKEFVQTNIKSPWYAHFHPYGSTTGCDMTYNIGILPIKNWQMSTHPDMPKLLEEGVISEHTKVKDTGCYNCYLQCGSVHDVKEGPFKGEGYDNPEYETMWAFGANCLNFDFKAILKANQICDNCGIDTMTTGTCVAFLMECYEKGYITKDDINGVDLKWGDGVAMCEIVQQIADRSSPMGEACANGGVRHCAQVVGHGSEKFAMHAKGLELAAYDPRGAKAHGVGYATSPIGGSHQTGYGMAEIFGMPEKVDRYTPYGKGKYTVYSQRFIMCCDTAVTCGFPTGFTPEALNFETFRDWVTMAAGPMDSMATKETMFDAFDRIFNVETLINIRHGVGDESNDLPDRLKEEKMPDGYAKGNVWERDILIKEYYEAREWTEKGVPKKELLERLGLTQAVKEFY
ncbi:MAG: aldehyde ferredoxin oxidoreductase family protein [Oscillospiraceae bacterium]